MPTVGELLANVSLFQGLTPADRERIAERGTVDEAADGTMLIREGDAANTLFVLLDGRVRVLRRDDGGRDVEIASLGQGDCFGEIALLDGGLRSASIVAAGTCRYFELHRDAFLEMALSPPSMMAKLLAELGRKTRLTSERLVRTEFETRMRETEAELARHRTISHTVTGLAHEMNTPLGVCVTMASLVEDRLSCPLPPDLAADLREPMAMIRSNLERAVSLMQAVVALAANHHGEPLERFDLAGHIEQTVRLQALQDRGCRLSVTLPDAPAPWQGYRLPVQTVIVELLCNAGAHAYPDGQGGPVEIALADGTLPGGLPAYRLTVRDRGVGIAPENRAKLLDPFFTTARGRGHKGLGLTIVYNTVTGALGGTLDIASEPGGGTAVTVTLPKAL